MNERYVKSFESKWLYKLLPAGIVLFITKVNTLMVPEFNLAVHILLFGGISSFLYTGGKGRKINRIVEVEALYIVIAVSESLGMLILDFLLKIVGRTPDSPEILKSMETAFSKIVVLFLYYVVFSRLWKRTELRTRKQYMLYFIMFLYSIGNIMMLATVSKKENLVVLMTSVGSIIFCNMYMLYFIQFFDERNTYKIKVEMMEQQEKLQYGNYKTQLEKYTEAMRVIHDVDKYVKQMENLYKEKLIENAIIYADQISEKLKELLPTKYTDNPIMNCLLAEKEKEAERLGIQFAIKNFTADLSFMKPIDITTLFGNVIDNAMAAAVDCTKNKYIELSVDELNDMLSIRVKNTVEKDITIKRGEMQNKGIGILNIERCVENYQGSIFYSCKKQLLCCDIILNRLDGN